MIAVDTVTRGEFEACLHEIFSLVLKDGTFPLELTGVRPLGGSQPEAKREPFGIILKAGKPIRLPQGTYRLETPRLGALDLFLVQISPTEAEAIFN